MTTTMRKIVIGLGVTALVLLGAYAVGLFDSEPSGPQVAAGQCASISGAADAPRFTAMDCGSDQANVKVAKVLDQGTCPTSGSGYSTYTSGVTLCLMPNFVEGNCYGQDKEAGLLKVPCGTARSVKVAKVLGGGAACGEQHAVSYPEPPVTFCLAKGDA